ncbi:hypothetical protein Tco_0762238 [Tanacetum coccineum]
MASRRDQRASSRGGNGCPSLSLVATALEEEGESAGAERWSLESVIVEVEEGRKKLRRSLGWLMRSVMFCLFDTCDKMLNRRAVSRITNYDVLTRKGPITLKVYREDGTSEIIPNFKASDLHLDEWREDPLYKLNDLANKKRKHADVIHDYFKANQRLKASVQYEDHLPGTVLNEPILVQEIFFRLHQGPELDDHAKTFSSLLLAEIDKRNLNPLKQMRVIEQLRK